MQVQCPTCQKLIKWSSDAEFRPFCSKQCQLIDLGEWANEEKSIPCSPNDPSNPAPLDIEDVEAILAEQSSSFFQKD